MELGARGDFEVGGGVQGCVYFERIRFIGYELFCNNICLRFQLDNGKQIRRMLNDDGVEYKHVAASDGVKEIVFTIL